MKPVLEHLPREAKESFVVRYFDYPYYPTPWHYHPEYELVLVTESTGTRFIGDQIKDFAPGDLALIGPNLPHLYRNDKAYYQDSSGLRASSIVVHFLEDSFGYDFLKLPEAARLRQLFQHAARGMDITGETNKRVAALLHRLVQLEGLSRWLKLIEILHVLAESTEFDFIASHAMQGRHEKDPDRLSKVMEHVLHSFQADISLEDTAESVNMSAAAFSRYFKHRTRKTFSSFVAEIRLGHASKLLQEDQRSIAEICFDSGFNNLSNFNRQFKKRYGLTPKEFKRRFFPADE